MSDPRLGPGTEFDVIRDILRDRPATAAFRVPPGDDAVVLATGATVVSTDLSVEDVHFRRNWLEADEVGYRAAAAALSDLAAMGAAATAVLVSLAGPAEDARTGYLARVGRGAAEAAESVGAALAGGDVTRSPGPVVVDVVVLGTVLEPWRRDGARPGDELWVTGPLGGAAGCVRLLEAHREPPAGLRAAFARPRPRLDVVEALAEAPVHGALDLSDGLLPDAGHLAAASGVALVLEADRVPVSPALAGAVDPADARALALAGGEDYELLLAMDPAFSGSGFDALRAELRERSGRAPVRVGRVEEGRGVRVVDGRGRPVETLPAGFEHFGRPS